MWKSLTHLTYLLVDGMKWNGIISKRERKEKYGRHWKWTNLTAAHTEMKRNNISKHETRLYDASRRFRIHIERNEKWKWKTHSKLKLPSVRVCWKDPLWITFHSIGDQRLVYDAFVYVDVVIARLVAVLSVFPVNNYYAHDVLLLLVLLTVHELPGLPYRRDLIWLWDSYFVWYVRTRVETYSMMYLLFSLLLSSCCVVGRSQHRRKRRMERWKKEKKMSNNFCWWWKKLLFFFASIESG